MSSLGNENYFDFVAKVFYGKTDDKENLSSKKSANKQLSYYIGCYHRVTIEQTILSKETYTVNSH